MPMRVGGSRKDIITMIGYVRRSFGFGLIGEVLQHLEIAFDHNPADALGQYQIEQHSGVLSVADLLRRCLSQLNSRDGSRGAAAAPDIDILQRDVETAARSLGAQHNQMTREFGARSKTFFGLEYLIHCLIYSGWTRSVADMAKSLESSLMVTVPFAKHRCS